VAIIECERHGASEPTHKIVLHEKGWHFRNERLICFPENRLLIIVALFRRETRIDDNHSRVSL
jgi:hypothetical protein